MARSRARQSYELLSSFLVSAVLHLSLALCGWAVCVSAKAEPLPLYLDVSVNGHPTKKIAAFLRHPDGRFSATRAELKELRIDAGGSGDPQAQVFLDAIDSLAFKYDEPNQAIAIELQPKSLQHTIIRASDPAAQAGAAESMTGAVLNYGLYGSINEHALTARGIHEGASLALEGRVFGTYGTLEASSITGFADFDSRRIDTSWSYSFPDGLVTLRAGDFISGGFGWTRPVRMAGFKIERDFALRPDLITKPLPSVSGSAAVPSTVDVYVNDIKTYSQEVPGGRFTIEDLPVVSGGGVARVVVREAGGRETVSETPFYSSSHLLRPGMWDYSAEVGLARLGYGTRSSDYNAQPLASASVRYGATEALTLAWHGEAGMGVINTGAGFVTRIGLFGTLETGVSASHHGGDAGAQYFVAVQGEIGRVTVNARSQRALADYTDVAAHASVEAKASGRVIANLAPAKAVDFVSVGLPVDATGGNLNATYVHTERTDGETFDVASLSYSQSLTDAISMHATAFKSFSDADGVGAYLGVTMSLGDRRSASTSLRRDKAGTGFVATYARSADDKPGSLGWRIFASQGQNDFFRADLDYSARKVVLRGSVARDAHGFSGFYMADGAIAITEDGLFVSRRINDAFAIVDAGAPDVEVRVENRVVGRTDRSGKLLVTGLHAYQKNKITIDPNSLPVNAQIPTTHVNAVPADRSGMAVRFGVESAPQSALVEFLKADGSLVAAGHTGRLVHNNATFVVGYDGQAFIEGLAARNVAEIDFGDGTCRAEFPFAPDAATQVLIRGVVCR